MFTISTDNCAQLYACAGVFARARKGFTLMELVAVITIIGILAMMVTPMVNSARKNARQADCRSNLHQFGAAFTIYRADHNGLNPPWMSALYPRYIDNRDIYVCKSDLTRGRGDAIPDEVDKLAGIEKSKYYANPLEDNEGRRGGRHPTQNDDIRVCSYFFEFSDAPVPSGWGKPEMDVDENGTVAWWEFKEYQRRIGDENNGGGDPADPRPYSDSRMPIIRCWHHYAEARVSGHKYGMCTYDKVKKRLSGRIFNNLPMTLNVAYAGNVFVCGDWWEGRLEPGEK